MQILILTRSFSPDSGIASVRMHMFAKYLSQYGHDITVIRSGQIIYNNPSRENMEGLDRVRIFSYEGEQSDAERYERGEWKATSVERRSCKDNMGRQKAAEALKNTFRPIIQPFRTLKRFYVDDGIVISRKIVRCAETHLKGGHFDCIISTFSPLGCVMAGEKLKKIFHAKWVIDFRDLMDNQLYTPSVRIINRITQKKFVRSADACFCVSSGNVKRLERMGGKGKTYLIRNGYDQIASEEESFVQERADTDDLLTICYTGTMYGDTRDAKPLFKILHSLCQEGHISQDRLKVYYAGNDGDSLIKQAKVYGLESIVYDKGYLSRPEVERLQKSSDLFLVLSWNTQLDQGILTGKFYEAIKSKKPIIAFVSGDLPNSELKELIEKYNLGACYECASGHDDNNAMKNYILMQYESKRQHDICVYNPDMSAFRKFSYPYIIKEVEIRLDDTIKQMCK